VFKKILVGFDGSHYAEQALRVALDLAQKYGATVTTVSVAHIPDFADSRDEVNGALEDAQKFYARPLARAREIAAGEGVALETRIVPGHPVDALVQLAEKEGYDLIVVGDRGLGGVKRYLLGSVTEKTVRYARCPVLVVKGGGADARVVRRRHG
jgi:nucleotide-binding universal stress UspA family protein